MKKQKASKPSHTLALYGPAYPSLAPAYLLECCWSLARRCNCTLPGRPGWSPPQGLAAGLSLARSESPAPPLTPWQWAQQLRRHTARTKQNGWRYWKETAAEGRQGCRLRKGKEQSGCWNFNPSKSKDEKLVKVFIVHKVYDTDLGTKLHLSVPESTRILRRIPSSNNIRTMHL